jgi:hypothetical protein
MGQVLSAVCVKTFAVETTRLFGLVPLPHCKVAPQHFAIQHQSAVLRCFLSQSIIDVSIMMCQSHVPRLRYVEVKFYHYYVEFRLTERVFNYEYLFINSFRMNVYGMNNYELPDLTGPVTQ